MSLSNKFCPHSQFDTPSWNGSIIMERLDWAFGSPSWKILFDKAKVYHLPRVTSDHSPRHCSLTKSLPWGYPLQMPLWSTVIILVKWIHSAQSPNHLLGTRRSLTTYTSIIGTFLQGLEGYKKSSTGYNMAMLALDVFTLPLWLKGIEITLLYDT
ncbi:hypothetical protein LIER_28768 [Lithospermum erythrorhizon]|uniref:Uncharacterized protein n=1 Tax=Lithospermum erythrorhizon TaxID=34254 RepID=A0AAV3RKE1_LITER